MRKDNPLAVLPVIQPEHLSELPLLCSRQLVEENGLSGWLGYDYEKLRIVTTNNLINNALLLVEEGVGYALSLDGLVNLSGDSPLCFRPLEPKLESWMYIVWKKYQVFSQAAELFLRELQATLQSDATP